MQTRHMLQLIQIATRILKDFMLSKAVRRLLNRALIAAYQATLPKIVRNPNDKFPQALSILSNIDDKVLPYQSVADKSLPSLVHKEHHIKDRLDHIHPLIPPADTPIILNPTLKPIHQHTHQPTAQPRLSLL